MDTTTRARPASPADDDATDVAAAVEGDGRAFARLVERHQKSVARQMWRFTRDRGVLDELVQDVFVAAYGSLTSWSGQAPFDHWLAVLATRTGYRHWRELERNRRIVSRSIHECDAAPEEAGNDGASALLFRILARLPLDDRVLLTLVHFEDCSLAEVARRMGWNTAMTKMRAFRARRRLRRLLEEEHPLEELS